MTEPQQTTGTKPLPIADDQAVKTIAHFLLMCPGAYLSPEAAAFGLLKRLASEGYHVAKS